MRIAAFMAAFGLIACAPTTSTDTTAQTVQTTPSTTPADDDLAPPTPGDISIHMAPREAGQVVHVPVNQRFAVELVGVPTAGYQWAPTQMPAFVTRVGDEITGPTIATQNQPGFAGGNHWEVYTFAATGPGSGDLVLEQRRPWEHSGPANATFRVTVTAQ